MPPCYARRRRSASSPHCVAGYPLSGSRNKKQGIPDKNTSTLPNMRGVLDKNTFTLLNIRGILDKNTSQVHANRGILGNYTSTLLNIRGILDKNTSQVHAFTGRLGSNTSQIPVASYSIDIFSAYSFARE